MSNCRFLTPCGICEIKSMSGVPYECDLRRNNNLDPRTKTPIPKFSEYITKSDVEDKIYTDKGEQNNG